MNVFLGVAGLCATLVTVWATIRYLVLMEIRIDANTFKTIYDLAKYERMFMLQQEYIREAKYPAIYVGFCFFKNCPWFYVNACERLLTAGHQDKEVVSTLICPRWKYKKLKNFLDDKIQEMQLAALGVPVEVITPHYTDKVGTLRQEILEPLQDQELWADIVQEAADVLNGLRNKSGCILYGPAGNGKTSS